MKTLLVLRHAKSSWEHAELSDHDRPLNARGSRDAPRIGRLLAEHGMTPSLLLTSTANRAATTARLVAEAAVCTGPVEEVEALYGASPEGYMEVVREYAGDHDPVLIVGHNPSIQLLVTMLSGENERMPTAALAWIDLPGDDWSRLREGSGSLEELWRPRELEPE